MTNVEYQQKMAEQMIEGVQEKEYLERLRDQVKEITLTAYEKDDYIGMVEDLIDAYDQLKEKLEREIQYRQDNFRQLTPAELGWENATC